MLYLAKAINPSGAITQLEIDADSASDAAARIVGQGLRVLSLVPSKSFSFKQVSWQGKFSLLTFSQELLSLLDAGLGLIEALNALTRKERRQADRAMLENILATLRRGETYSSALARFPMQFPPIYIAAVQASERTSNLKEALDRYITYAEQYDKAKNKNKWAGSTFLQLTR